MKGSPLPYRESPLPSYPSSGGLDLEVYADAWAELETERARVMADEGEVEDERDEDGFERLERLEDERDAAFEAFERAVEPYLRLRLPKAKKRRVAA